MNRLSAHIGYLYTDLPLRDRLVAAARDGFTAVEHPEPWEMRAPEMARRLGDLGLTFSQISSGMGSVGEKGLAALPGREGAFRDGFARALDYAQAVGCPFVHPMAGVAGNGTTYQANIAWALRVCEGTGVRVLVEAITIPGYHMNSLAAACTLQDDHPDIALLFDSYHARVLGLDPADWLGTHGARVGHVHIADHPGRHEPGTGTIDFAALLSALHGTGYNGAIGFELVPTAAPASLVQGWSEFRRTSVT